MVYSKLNGRKLEFNTPFKRDCKESDRYSNVFKYWYDSTENQASLSL